ncbi:MAG: hypothetical protein MR871_12850 [Lachnospiraceae bacterium]|nr:hypothetical protein [Lachnospiraceae bacterium]MDY3745991.1 hypothetical protein [Lachnospiraceae bacterium]
MTFEEKLENYRKTAQIQAREDAIQRTIQMSKAAFYAAEQDQVMSYHEFLFAQFKMIQKRWWGFQFLILLLFWISFPLSIEIEAAQKSMGVTASLFTILIIPELWKNRNSQSMEIEAASYYSLRQIYAARMTLFGIVDVALITLFCGVASTTLNLALSELLTQFLFPMVITACICFGILCSKHPFTEFVAIGMCMIWGVFWWLLILNETIYTWITVPVWIGLFGIALVFLCFAVYRILNSCNNYWEVNLDGIKG